MRRNGSYLKGIVLILVVTAVIASLCLFDLLPVDDIIRGSTNIINETGKVSESFINNHKTIAPVIYIIIFLLRTFLVVFSCSVMVVIAGRAFGSAMGFTLSLIAISLSATLAFILGRFLDKRVIERILKNKLKNFDSKMEKHGFRIILFMRLSMLFPFDIINYAAGMSKIRYRDFILGTMIGIIPEVFSLTYLGDKINNPFSVEFLIAVLLIIFTISVSLTIRRVRNKKG